MTETAEAALPIDPAGKLYQQRAHQALPLLVRQAQAGCTIYYGDLAAEMGMPNARNLNFVLGSVATSLVRLSDEWGKPIPPLQAIVINRADEMPGPGFVHSLVDPKILANVGNRTRRQVVDGMLAEVYMYSDWNKVLTYFGITPAALPVSPALLSQAGVGFGGGESPDHLRFKEYIAANPACLDVAGRGIETEVEYCLPTGDRIDVLFKTRKRWTAAEVKSARSAEPDLVRGVFQCVKYRALLDAVVAASGTQIDVTAYLVLEGTCPPDVLKLGNVLGVTIIDRVGADSQSSD